MQKKYAVKLHNQDQVEVRVNPGEWVYGYVVGDPMIKSSNVYFDIQTNSHGYIKNVSYLDIR